MKLVRTTVGAGARHDNLAPVDAKVSQLSTVRLKQVNGGLLAQIGSLFEQVPKLNAHLGSHLEAAWSDPRPSRDPQILGPSVKAIHHRLNGFRQNFLYGAPPSCMDCGYRPVMDIGN